MNGIDEPIPFTLKHSVMAELDRNPVVAGGVICTG